MPNYCLNKVTINGDQNAIKDLLAFVKGKESDFEFNRIIPMPASIAETERGSISFASEAVCLYLKDKTVNTHLAWMLEKNQIDIADLETAISRWEEEKKISLKLGYRIIENRRLYNCGDWYEWSIENWGTKWDACEVVVTDNIITFESAWSPCSPAIEKLSIFYPMLDFDYRYFEPGINLAGKELYSGGECTGIEIYEYENEDYRLLAQEFGYEFS